MHILLDLEDVTDFEGQSFAFRLDIESAGYVSEDIAQALCEQFEVFLTWLKYQLTSPHHSRVLGGPQNRRDERKLSGFSVGWWLL
uniref:Archease domain-containing protein n=1 Tax=Angiostrongylus cantonensis TaxID=6313 RepID=A0A0K0D667_ANGCA